MKFRYHLWRSPSINPLLYCSIQIRRDIQSVHLGALGTGFMLIHQKFGTYFTLNVPLFAFSVEHRP